MLREVARRILASVRNYDYVGRYGGEEFLIVLAECSAADLAVTAERMRVCISKKIGVGTLERLLDPSASSMPFMRSELCSFIWQPNVVRW